MDIFEYNDYRHFLRDICKHKRATTSFFSYRYLAQKAGIRSSGFISSVVSGNRNLTPTQILDFARILGLSKKETDFFELLVHFNQAKNHDGKKRYFEKMRPFRTGKASVLSVDQYEFYDKWYHAAIRELVFTYKLRDDYKRISLLLEPQITPTEARKSIELLVRLGLIRKNDCGYYEQTDTIIRASESLRPLIIHNYQSATIGLAHSALQRISKESRDISTLTMSVDSDTIEFIKGRLTNLRAELLDRIQHIRKPDSVYQLNIQLFPLSKGKEYDTGKNK